MSTTVNRIYASKRQRIVNALVRELKTISKDNGYNVDLDGCVTNRLLFWDEVDDFPSVNLTASSETRDYQGAGVKDRFLTVIIRCYVNEDNAQDKLSLLIEDIETLLESKSRLYYGPEVDPDDPDSPVDSGEYTHTITINTIDTDEGLLEPLGVGEITIEVMY